LPIPSDSSISSAGITNSDHVVRVKGALGADKSAESE
jgi:hypothetical protein